MVPKYQASENKLAPKTLNSSNHFLSAKHDYLPIIPSVGETRVFLLNHFSWIINGVAYSMYV